MTAAHFLAAAPEFSAIAVARAASDQAAAGDRYALRCRWEYRPSEGRLVQIWESRAVAA